MTREERFIMEMESGRDETQTTSAVCEHDAKRTHVFHLKGIGQ